MKARTESANPRLAAASTRTDDTRQYQRVRSYHLLKVTSEGLSRAEEVTNVSDLSAGGVRFSTSNRWHRQDRIAVALNVNAAAGNRVISATARVTWIARVEAKGYYVVGAEFTDLGDEDRAFLDAEVAEQLEQRDPPPPRAEDSPES